jgi:hypothetical protein
MKADIWNLVDILMNHDPRQGQLIPEEMMPFNLAGEALPPPPQELEGEHPRSDCQTWIVDFANYSNE